MSEPIRPVVAADDRRDPPAPLPAPRFAIGPPVGLTELLVLLGVLGVFAVLALLLIAAGAPLGHDEAVYALKGRQLQLGGSSRWYWADYRAPGLPLLFQVTWLVSGTEPYLRATVAAFGALGVVVVWLMGRYLFGRVAGIVAAAGLAVTSPWLASATSVWPDVPGAVLGLAVLAIVLFATNGERASWWILAAAPLATLATLVRFGAVMPMAVGVAAVLVWRWRTALRSWVQLSILASISGGASGAILFLPSVVGARTAPFTANRLLLERNATPASQGFVDYLKQLDYIAGAYFGLLAVVGFTLAAVYAWRDPGRRGPWAMVLAVAGGTFLWLGLVLHGEYRYLAPVYPLVWILAGWGLAEAATALRRLGSGLTRVVAGVLILAVPLSTASHSDFEVVVLDERFDELRAASRVVDRAHGYEDCGVITSYVSQVAWYTECVTRPFLETPTLESSFFPHRTADYVFFLAGGKRQPEGELRDAYIGSTDGIFAEAGVPDAGRFAYAAYHKVAEGG